VKFSLLPECQDKLLILCGPNQQHLDFIEREMKVSIMQRGFQFKIISDSAKNATDTQRLIERIYAYCQTTDLIDIKDINLHIHHLNLDHSHVQQRHASQIVPKTPNQIDYVNAINNHTITFGIGPAGTGKTLLATSCAIQLLKMNSISKIIISRPVVESGEQLGFLPGDLQQKVHPYMVPLFDCLSELIGSYKLAKLQENGTIEIAPLAYMRGRSLKNACIILDEAQNSTPSQMKMLLTRLADNSRMIINGDIQQIDLKSKQSGLIDASTRLVGIDEIKVVQFTTKDVMRHPLITKIIEAYDK
tara:strand:- start:838 stop:1746 length:909 start_codon:yes stop_codon:yes gene_type:complete